MEMAEIDERAEPVEVIHARATRTPPPVMGQDYDNAIEIIFHDVDTPENRGSGDAAAITRHSSDAADTYTYELPSMPCREKLFRDDAAGNGRRSRGISSSSVGDDMCFAI